MSNTENPVTNSIYALGRKVSELLKLGDTGKVDSFITRVKSQLEREISILDRNLDTARFEFKQEILTLKDTLEDNEAALEDAYANINPASVKTNADQKVYAEEYLANISKAKFAVKEAQEAIDQAEAQHELKINDAKNRIKDLKDTLKNVAKPA